MQHIFSDMKRETQGTDTADTRFLAGTTRRTRKTGQSIPHVDINAVSFGNHTKHKGTNFQQRTEFLTSKNMVDIFTIVLLVMNEKYTILKLTYILFKNELYCLTGNTLISWYKERSINVLIIV
jgi:hypothetical protein